MNPDAAPAESAPARLRGVTSSGSRPARLRAEELGDGERPGDGDEPQVLGRADHRQVNIRRDDVAGAGTSNHTDLVRRHHRPGPDQGVVRQTITHGADELEGAGTIECDLERPQAGPVHDRGDGDAPARRHVAEDDDGSGLEETGQDVGHGEDRFLEEPTGRPTWRDESSRAEPGIPNVDTA